MNADISSPSSAHDDLNTLLKEAGVSKTVYAFVMPETEKALDELLDEDRNGIHAMYREAWTQKQGAVHEEFLEAWRDWSSPVVKFDAKEFPFSYTTFGASEALREAIYAYGHRARVEGFAPVVHVFDGEYEGFAAYATAAGIPVVAHDRRHWRESLGKIGPRDQFYLSHPSAIDGNVWPDFSGFAAALYQRQPTAALMLDLSYVGCVARPFGVDAASPNIKSIFFSLSKPMGVYYHRMGGLWSREAYPGLFGNKWFKNLLSLRLGVKMLKEYGVHDLPAKYARLAQGRAAADVSAKLGLSLVPSDAYMLATAPLPRAPSDLEGYLTRAGALRLCLTPTIAHIIDPSVSAAVRSRPHEGVERRENA